jgi:hypothetical protein
MDIETYNITGITDTYGDAMLEFSDNSFSDLSGDELVKLIRGEITLPPKEKAKEEESF